MKISQKGIDLIKSFEGCRLKSYQDSVKVWTIGYGHTHGVKTGQVITQAQAETLLKCDLQTFENGVNSLVKIDITQSQFDALVSFAYNCGLGNLKTSTLLKDVNSKRFEDASKEFLRWNKAGGKELRGLTRRRTAEMKLFLSK